MPSAKKITLEQYKIQVTKRLRELTPFLQRVAMGEFSKSIKLSDKDDEFTELAVSINLMIEDLREMKEELEYKNIALQSVKKDLELKNKEKIIKLKENEEKFKLIFNGVKDSIYFHRIPTKNDVRGEFLEVNQAAIDQLGYSRNEFLQMDPVKIDDPVLAKKVLPIISEKLKNKGEATFEMVHITKIGEKIPVEITSRVVNFKGVKTMLSVARDLRESKRMALELQEKLEELEKLNKFMIGRELKMVELKEEIKNLKNIS